MTKIRFVGLDVHADTIAVAVGEKEGEVRSLGIIANRLESIRKMIGKLGPTKHLKCCYEAGPTGYVLYWQLVQLGVACEVIAPTLVPVKAGDRVKTDRRDAEKLARCYRAGELTPVWVPDAEHEALRDLVRAREAAKKDQLRARHPEGGRARAEGLGTLRGREQPRPQSYGLRDHLSRQGPDRAVEHRQHRGIAHARSTEVARRAGRRAQLRGHDRSDLDQSRRSSDQAPRGGEGRVSASGSSRAMDDLAQPAGFLVERELALGTEG